MNEIVFSCVNIIAYKMQAAPADEADAVCLWKQIYEESYVLYERGALYIYAPAGRSSVLTS